MTSTAASPSTSSDVPAPVTPATDAPAAVAAARKPADTRTPAQIEADLIATRERLAGRIDELQAYVTPSAVAGRGLTRIKRIYVDEFGGIRPERVAVTVAVVALVLGLGALRRRSR